LLESFSNRLAEINAQVTEINAQLAEALADDVADTELIAQLQAELEALNNQAVTLQQDVETRTADLAEAAATVPQPTPTPGPTDGSGTPTPTPTTPQTAAETAAQSAKDQVARDEKQAREMRNQSNRR
jgi:DNA repair exonuclease SbcCD ATPase subunit